MLYPPPLLYISILSPLLCNELCILPCLFYLLFVTSYENVRAGNLSILLTTVSPLHRTVPDIVGIQLVFGK